MESIIVTGCTDGLGLALHDELVHKKKMSHSGIFVGRELGRLRQSEAHSYFEADLSEKNDWSALLHLIKDDCLKVTLISNASTIEPIEQVANLNHLDFMQAHWVNFIEPANLTSSLIYWMQETKKRVRIINISTGAADRPVNGWSVYCSSKAAFKMFLSVANLENPNLEVINYDPGIMDTKMQKKIRDTAQEKMKNVDRFIEYKLMDQLNSPSQKAKEIRKLFGL